MYIKTTINNIENDLIKVMIYRSKSKSYIDYYRWEKLMKEICDVLEVLYGLEKA